MVKYQPPCEGSYEAGLTARVLYDTFETLLTPLLEEAKGLHEAKWKDTKHDKLWEHEKIRTELEDFVESFFQTDLSIPPSLEEALSKGIDYAVRNMEDYMPSFEDSYGKAAAREKTKNMFHNLNSRLDEFLKSIEALRELEEDIIKTNASDAFAHILAKYMWIQRAENFLDEYCQS